MSRDHRARSELIGQLVDDMREWSTWTVLFHSVVAQRLGLHTTDHKCLDILMRVGPVPAGYLAELTGLTTGAITGVIDRLEKAGLVRREKDPADRRRVLVRVEMEEAMRRIGPVFASFPLKTEEVLSRYSEAELALLRDFIQRSIEAMRESIPAMREGERDESEGE